MKIVAILGSPRPAGNTSFLIDQALQEAATHGIETEKIILAQYNVNPCLGHYDCSAFSMCKQEDDAPAILEKFRNADGIILGSPVYYFDMTAQMKAFIDRNYFSHKHKMPIRAVCTGLIAVGAGGGLEDTVDAMKRFIKFATRMSDNRILTVTAYAGKPGEIQGNKDSVEDAKKLGGRMAKIITSAHKTA